MAPSRRIVAIVALAALAITGCSRNNAKASDIKDAMTDAGLTDKQASCVARELDDALDQDKLNDLAAASTPEDYPEGTQETVDSVFSQCDVTGESGPTTTAADSGDTTDTTGADDTTTTTAG